MPLSDSIVTLGVTLDSNLSFRHDVSKVCRSAHFHLRALRHIRAALTDDMAKTVAVSLIHSRIDCANSLIHGSINVRRLRCVQNSAARVVLRDTPHQSTIYVALLSELHWLPVQSRITFKIACPPYKVLTTGQPYYPRSLLHYYTPHRTLRSVNQRLLEQPRVSTEFPKRSFSYLSPKTWNSLPSI